MKLNTTSYCRLALVAFLLMAALMLAMVAVNNPRPLPLAGLLALLFLVSNIQIARHNRRAQQLPA